MLTKAQHPNDYIEVNATAAKTLSAQALAIYCHIALQDQTEAKEPSEAELAQRFKIKPWAVLASITEIKKLGLIE
jgi:hypothetical protein